MEGSREYKGYGYPFFNITKRKIMKAKTSEEKQAAVSQWIKNIAIFLVVYLLVGGVGFWGK